MVWNSMRCFLVVGGLLAMTMVSGILQAADAPLLVFVTGDEEYRSEESMPMLAKILKRDYGFRVSVCYSLDEQGHIDPNNVHSIAGLEALENADMMIVFTRFRRLSEKQMRRILDFADSGKPLAGFRTATHAFAGLEGKLAAENHDHASGGFGRRVFGQTWITHHGHHGDQVLTKVTASPDAAQHPILRGVKPFSCYSWLYHVDGGSDKLLEGCRPLLAGQALKSKHQRANRLDQYPMTGTVAWTRMHTGSSGKPARVFFTTLGHPYDFQQESMRKLALNGILWALGREAKIPTAGAKAATVGKYNPNNAGFDDKFKQNRKPEAL